MKRFVTTIDDGLRVQAAHYPELLASRIEASDDPQFYNLVVDFSQVELFRRMTEDELESAVWTEYSRWSGFDPEPT